PRGLTEAASYGSACLYASWTVAPSTRGGIIALCARRRMKRGMSRTPAAVILAGGRGERLGGMVKAELRVGGVRLLDRVLPIVAGCRPVVVAHGPHDPARLELPAGA